jgi:hypothetical protein
MAAERAATLAKSLRLERTVATPTAWFSRTTVPPARATPAWAAASEAPSL